MRLKNSINRGYERQTTKKGETDDKEKLKKKVR